MVCAVSHIDIPCCDVYTVRSVEQAVTRASSTKLGKRLSSGPGCFYVVAPYICYLHVASVRSRVHDSHITGATKVICPRAAHAKLADKAAIVSKLLYFL